MRRALGAGILVAAAGLLGLARAAGSVARKDAARFEEPGRAREAAMPLVPAHLPADAGRAPLAARQDLDRLGSSTGTLASVVASVRGPAGEQLGRAALLLRHGARAAGRAELDATGVARFTGLVPGRYSLELEPGSLPPGWLPAPCAHSGTPRVPFVLARGKRHAIELVALRSARLRGRTLDADGLPLAGASVHLQPTDLAFDRPLSSVQSDARGAFAFDDLVPASYRLWVGWPPGEASAPPAPSVLVLDANALVELTLRGDPAPRSIVGRLVDAEGLPLAGVVVQCEALPANPAPPSSASLVLARARTAADGSYRLSGLPQAEVQIRAAPRSGSALGLHSRDAGLAELLLAPLDLRSTASSLDVGTTRVD